MIDVASHKYEWQPIPPMKTTADQEKLIRDPMAYLVIKSAFFAYILYQECTIVYTEEVPLAATDGKGLYFNPVEIKHLDWSIPNIAFVVCHEVAHVVLGDLAMMAKWRDAKVVDCGNGVILPYHHELMNCAQDYRINAMLVEAKIGEMPSIGLYDKKYSEKGMESAVEIYVKLWKETKGGKCNMPSGGFDLHMTPSQQHVKAVESGRIGQVMAAAAMNAEGQGSIPAAIKTLVGDILEPKVSWQDYLKSTINRLAGDPQYDWTTIDRRLLVRPDPIYFAKQAHTGAGTIAIGYDTSGSCVNPKIQQRFFSEMAGIVGDLNPKQLVIFWCDAAVQRVDDLEDPEDLIDLHCEINKLGGAPGGGGTDFRPVFKQIEDMEIQPDMLVYLTDTFGCFPSQEPNYPVIWASIAKGVKVPFGTLIEVEL